MNSTQAKLEILRAELADLAFVLDRRGRCDAADVAATTAARIEELRTELAAECDPQSAEITAPL